MKSEEWDYGVMDIEQLMGVAYPAHKESCVYVLLKNKEVVYVGQNKNGGFARIACHIQYSDYKFDSYVIIPCRDSEVSAVEAKYILKYQPKHNSCIPGNPIYLSITAIQNKYKIWWDIPRLVKWCRENKVKPFPFKKQFFVNDNLFYNAWHGGDLFDLFRLHKQKTAKGTQKCKR